MTSGGDDTVPAEKASGADPRVGSTVGKYVVARLLGRGGMGAVYEARHALLSRRVALKFLLPQFAEHPELLKRFENEAKAAGRLEHPNIAAVLDFGRTADGAPYLVMEYLEGEDCAHLLERHGRLPVARAVDIVRQACRGLVVAHRAGIVHRDLKPENLFIARAGDGADWVKVLDFGIAKLRETDAGVPTRTGATLGTAYYMSPEQARGATDVDERTDVWSLGVVLYQLLSGERPFRGAQFLHVVHQILSTDPASLSTLMPDLPEGLAAVVGRAMNKDLALRLPTVEALESALAPFAERSRPSAGVAEPVAEPPLCTQLAPATSIDGVSIGDTGIGPRRGLEEHAEPAKPPSKRRHLAAFAGAVLVASVLAALFASRRAGTPELAEPSAATSALPSPPAPAAPDAKAHVTPKSSAEAAFATVTAPSSSAERASAPPAVVATAREAPARPSTFVRSSSEHAERSSNIATRAGVPAAATVAPAASLAPAAPAEPTISQGSRTDRRALEIEKGNPYE